SYFNRFSGRAKFEGGIQLEVGTDVDDLIGEFENAETALINGYGIFAGNDVGEKEPASIVGRTGAIDPGSRVRQRDASADDSRAAGIHNSDFDRAAAGALRPKKRRTQEQKDCKSYGKPDRSRSRVRKTATCNNE